ncbi:putative ribonuclease H-like domain-containing protein [Tanacetum coccineum]|uniref:Ribonuclease H-like domain-containing protein n=1 Tax=Tanacetum coccineum TaxID=301880 RepID=A0ABQ5GIA6_9ASTR
MPPTPDLSFTGLDELVNKPTVENRKSDEEVSKVVRKSDDSPIIEDWVSDSEEENVSQTKTEKKIVKLSIAKIVFVKPKQQEKTARKTVKQNLFLRAVLMKSGLVSVNTARQVNTAHSKTTVNAARPMSYLSKTAYSTVKRPIHKNTTFKNSNIDQRVNTVSGKNFNTAIPKAVVNAFKGNSFNVVKALACWVWKPKTKVLGHVSKHNSNPQMDLQDQGVIDSGCSRHMTGNMSYLTDYEEIDGGYVAFGGNPKGGKIIRKAQYSEARILNKMVAERRNRTLIEAARTMLADSKLPLTFWAEAVNTTCYVQNRVLVVKPHNMTPYELFHGRTPTLSFMRPLRCPVTIFNTIDHLGKFDGKADEGFFVGYSLNSSGPDWLFDIDALTRTMNYEPIVACTQSNGFAGTKKVDEDPRKDSECNDQEKKNNVNSTNNVNAASTNEVNAVGGKTSIELPVDPNMPSLENYTIFDFTRDNEDDGIVADMNNLDTTIQVSPIPIIRIHKDHPLDQVIGDLQSATQTRKMSKNLKEHGIEAIRLFLAYASFKDFMVYQMDVKSDFLYGKIEEEVYVCQPPGFEDPNFPDRVYKVKKNHCMDYIKLLELGDILLVQVYVDDIIFGSTKKELCIAFEKLMHEKFQMSSMGELTFFLGLQVKQKKDGIFISQDKYVDEILKKFGFTEVKTASTPMETQKPLLKDEDGEEVDVHMYRSMIGSLMYLTSSRPDIMFAVCACARYQVNPKVSHLHAVKRIFRYLKGQPKLGLWYPKDSPFDLVAYTDSDYAGASLDRKSTTGGYQFLGCRLISWQCKKQTVVANSTTEAEYVVASSYRGQVLWIQNQLLDYGKSK